ncbi:2d27d111-a7df-4dfd-b53e-66ee884047f0 [Thermothielavioides terrestris]|uniref:2d27d111-a7df-4dfd-b53e-66ee884047f0 n=1 Tax=Thermothielavioides terrestris TaxID=2587410 RepID=A0A446BYD1_9PEZI|nr:2d27d111-a7df-4dfd-b53e-66ee884047f0 [Thermothielavioides terrestris]
MANEHHARVAQWQGDLLPNIIDRLARDLPDAVYGEWPVLPTSYDAGFYAVTYAQLANAVNGLAWWLIDRLGRPSAPTADAEVLAYMGPNDVRLTALMFAAAKTGYVVFLPSPRNSAAAHQALFETLQCRLLATPDPVPAPAVAALEAVKPRHLTVPGVEELLHKDYPPYVSGKVFEKARWDPLVIVHTSGSTGIPKPLIWTHETVARQQNTSVLAAPEGMPSLNNLILGKRILNTLPHFHAAGLAQYMLTAIPFGSVVISPATATIATAEGVVQALKRSPADIAVLAPSIVAELARNDELLDYCAKHLKLITYMGGDLPQALGDRVAAKVPLRCHYGASEIGIPAQLLPAEPSGPSDWHYVRFHPSCSFVFEEATDGLFELVIPRDEALADTQVVFSIRGLDQLQKEYRTRDLFEPHPTEPGAWCWRARADDVIVFLNGEKTNPVSMEHYIAAHAPELSAAMVVGAQRFQAALLVEPAGVDRPLTTAEQAALIERIWPVVEEANRAAPAHARVEKSLILVTTPDRRLIRTPKGTVQRAPSLAQYAAEIDRLYADADVVPEDDDAADDALDPTDLASVSCFVRDSVAAVTGWAGVDDAADFFERGMDSLQVLQLARALRRGLYRPDLGIPTVYQNPTVRQLAAAVVSQKKNKEGQANGNSSAPSKEDPDREIMLPLLSTYRALVQQIPARTNINIAQNQRRRHLPLPEPVDVILTGSTGALGTLILRALLARPSVNHVYCLNRSADGGRAAQMARLAAAGAAGDAATDAPPLDAERVSFLHADLAHPQLGLDNATYATLRARAGLILHCAWPVNFNLVLGAFRPQLVGVVNLAALAAAGAARPMRLVFISSVGAVGGGGWETREGVVNDGGRSGSAPPEEVIYEELDRPFANGYSRSKFLAELLCDTAARHLGLPVSVLRVGQVAGSVGGRMAWNRSEWLPSLVLSSLLHLGCLPDSLGRTAAEVDWMPADVLADVVCDLALANSSQPGGNEPNGKDRERDVAEATGAEVFQLRNPRTTSWRALLPAVVAAARARFETAPEIVPPSVWLARLEESMAGPAEAEAEAKADKDTRGLAVVAMSNPALKLIDFYREGLSPSSRDAHPALMSVKQALAASPTLRDMPAVSQELMRKWVEIAAIDLQVLGYEDDDLALDLDVPMLDALSNPSTSYKLLSYYYDSLDKLVNDL